MSKPSPAIWLAVVLVLVGAGVSLSTRWRVESRNRAVAMAMEIEPIRDAAAAEGVPLASALDRLKTAGLRAVILNEETIGELVARRVLDWKAETDGVSVSGSPELVQRVVQGIARIYPAAGPGPTFALEPDMFGSIPVGLNPDHATAARQAGLILVARHANADQMTPTAIRSTLASSRELGATIFLPLGERVLGQRDLIPYTERVLREQGWLYATVEFGRIAGDAAMAARLPDRLVRLHSIQAAEIDRLSPAAVIERYSKAYRERNIRLLLVRPFSGASASPLSQIGESVQKIGRGLMREGGELKAPRPFEEPKAPGWSFVLIGVGAMAIAFWVGTNLFTNMTIRAAGAAMAGLFAALSLSEAGRPILALAAAFMLPIAGYLIGFRRLPAVAMTAIVGFGLLGGLCVAGLLNSQASLVQIDQAMGIKLAHFGPIVAIGLWLVSQTLDWRAALRSPVTWLAATLALLVAGALGFMLLRTGNEAPSAVSGFELRIRALLEAILYARPRTKEFLIGHPALVVGTCLASWSARRNEPRAMGWAALLLTVGAIAPTSIVNTLTHLHSPLDMALARIATGLVLGVIVGAAAWAVLRRILERGRTA